MSRELRHMNHSPSSMVLRRNARMSIAAPLVTLAFLLAVTREVFLAAKRWQKVVVPDKPGSSTAVPLGIQSKVSAQPTPNWKLTSRNVSTRSSLKQIQMLNATHGWMRAYPGELYTTSNAAEKWERVEAKLPERAYLTDIYFVSPDTGWVAASCGVSFGRSCLGLRLDIF